MSRYRQAILVAVVIATLLNGFILAGAVSGYKYYGNVFPLTIQSAERDALWIEAGIVLLASLAWWRS